MIANAVDLSCNLGIIHLSDLHISDQISFLRNKRELLFPALKDDFLNCSHIYIAISGDIANAGQPSEYEIVRAFLEEFEGKLPKIQNSGV